MLDIRRMKVLREVADAGSFSAAADRLHLSQSAVSQQIATLEREVGMQLLDRSRSGVRPTDAGVRLVAHADAVIARLEEAERELRSLTGLDAGRLSMASFPSASATLVTAAVSEFRRRHANIELQLVEAEPEESLPQLRRGAHDLALVYDFEMTPEEPERDIERALLLAEEMHVVVAAGHHLAHRDQVGLDELADEAWLCGVSRGTCREGLVKACMAAGFEPGITLESNDYSVLQGLVAGGLGVTLLPDLALQTVHPGIRVIDVEGRPPIRRVWAATLADGSRSPATAEMIGILAETAQRHAGAVAA